MRRTDAPNLVEKVLVNHIFNPLDFLFVCCCRNVAAVGVSILERLVLWLEVFSIDMWRRMAVEKLALKELRRCF